MSEGYPSTGSVEGSRRFHGHIPNLEAHQFDILVHNVRPVFYELLIFLRAPPWGKEKCEKQGLGWVRISFKEGVGRDAWPKTGLDPK